MGGARRVVFKIRSDPKGNRSYDYTMPSRPSHFKSIILFRNLKVIQEDIDEFKIFLNSSYHANEFYVRDIVGFVMYAFNESSITSHIESLPAIVNEIWEVMGDTGKKIHQSINWVIEKVSVCHFR